MNILKKSRKEPLSFALTILLILQFALIAYSNLTLIKNNLDCDTGRLFNHVAEMWRHKTLALPNWDYSFVSTLEWDCSSLFALPIYALTHNIILSFGLSNILFLGFFLCIIFFLFRGQDSIYPLFCANLLIIPYRIGMLDYYNMLFFGGAQYIIKVSVPLILTGLIVNMEMEEKHSREEGGPRHSAESSSEKNGQGKHREQKKPVRLSKSVIAFAVIYLCLLFITSASSGLYVTISGLFPIFAVYAIYKFFHLEERIPASIICVTVTSGILVLLGRYINTLVMGGARGESMLYCSVGYLYLNFSSCVFGMFELFGGATRLNQELIVLSVDGIELLVKCILVLLMLGCGILAAKKHFRGITTKMSSPELRGLLLVSIFLWNLFILCITDTKAGSVTFEYRYHLIGMLPLLCVTVSQLLDGIGKLKKPQKSTLYIIGYLTVLFLCLTSYRTLYTQEQQYADLEALCDHLKDADVDYIYLYDGSNDSEICRVISEDTSYLCLLDSGVTWAYDFYEYYVNAPMQTENVIVVVNDDQYEFGESFEIAGQSLKKYDSIANRSLYIFTQNQ